MNKKKTIKFILLVLILGVFVFSYFKFGKEKVVETPNVLNSLDKKELCYALFSTPNKDGLFDKYTLRIILDGNKANGELNFVPAEKDSKTGEIGGTVGSFDKTTMTRTADLWWFNYGEGISAQEQMKIILSENNASIGAGELIDRGDGVYVYKEPNNLHWGLNFPVVSCLDLAERTNVEGYLKDNISTLSPVKAVLGGTWYIFSTVIDLEKNTGTVVYEDGHIQEKRNFSYTTDEKREVQSLTIN